MTTEWESKNNIPKEKVEAGKIYTLYYDYEKNGIFVFESKGFDGKKVNCGAYLQTIPNKFENYSYAYFSENMFAEATQEQINWLKACIAANRFIPLEEVVEKEIYFHIFN